MLVQNKGGASAAATEPKAKGKKRQRAGVCRNIKGYPVLIHLGRRQPLVLLSGLRPWLL